MPASSPAFSAFSDPAGYFAVPGGTFENGAPGWSLNNASIASGNEPWYVNSAGDSHSLNVAPGGSATSASVCVSSLFPSWRFFARSADGSSASQLHVSVVWSDNYGHSGVVPAYTFTGSSYGSWQATPRLILGSVLPPGLTLNVRFVFSADPNGGAWNIDDAYVDPYAI